MSPPPFPSPRESGDAWAQRTKRSHWSELAEAVQKPHRWPQGRGLAPGSPAGTGRHQLGALAGAGVGHECTSRYGEGVLVVENDLEAGKEEKGFPDSCQDGWVPIPRGEGSQSHPLRPSCQQGLAGDRKGVTFHRWKKLCV